jgi:lipid-A-disaccharide synthase
MGISAVLRGLPRLVRRIGQTASAIAAERPDCLITIDSPDFSLRVAKKLRAMAPDVPIIHYVCPSVWAWRPGRAPAMASFVDHVLCILPFEVEVLKRLEGPAGTYVGHRLTHEPGILKAAEAQAGPRDLSDDRVKTLLLLPGSRGGEVGRLLEPFGKTVSILKARGHRLRLVLPTVPHVAEQVRLRVATWDQQPEILLEADRKWQAFGRADAALIASGTVSLELALSGVPMMSTYKLDPGARLLQRYITTWSALLPNLIADRPIVPEAYNEYVRPPSLARYIEALWSDTGMRRWQVQGFEEVRRRMRTDRPAGEIAAEAVLKVMRRKNAGKQV